MNKKFLALISTILCLVCLVCGCAQQGGQETPTNAPVSDGNVASAGDVISDGNAAGVFEDGAVLGEGAIALTIKVVGADAVEKTFTVNTNADNLGDALLNAGLVDGDDGAYGLYIKFVNGVRADYDLDKAYWALQKNGEVMMTGASDTVIADGEQYELIYTAD